MELQPRPQRRGGTPDDHASTRYRGSSNEVEFCVDRRIRYQLHSNLSSTSTIASCTSSHPTVGTAEGQLCSRGKLRLSPCSECRLLRAVHHQRASFPRRTLRLQDRRRALRALLLAVRFRTCARRSGRTARRQSAFRTEVARLLLPLPADHRPQVPQVPQPQPIRSRSDPGPYWWSLPCHDHQSSNRRHQRLRTRSRQRSSDIPVSSHCSSLPQRTMTSN